MVIVKSAGISDVGRKRPSNEDRILIDDGQRLYLVADGMGGHQAGEVASALVVQSICDFLSRPALENDVRPHGSLSAKAYRLLAGIEWSNRLVHQASNEHADYRGMGSTVAAVCFSEDTLIAANVGDSPIYLIRSGMINLLSVPHTLQAELPFDAQAPFMSHILTRAVGPKSAVEADICELNCFKDDRLVICSDGLSTKVAPEEISAIAAAHSPADSCSALVELANERGGEDNISAVVLRVSGIRRRPGTVFGKGVNRLKHWLRPVGNES